MAHNFRRGKGVDDHNVCPAERTSGVEIFPERYIFEVEPVELVENIEEVFDRPGDPIRRPDQDSVELAAAGVGHHGIEPRPFGLGAGDFVSEHRDDFVAALAGYLPEVVQLRLGMLIERADPHVKRGALQARLFLLGLEAPNLPS